MDFYSAYRQGFVRVAACTHHTTIGDPAANADVGAAAGPRCHDDGVALAVFPELTLSGYSIEDILLQDALLDAVEQALLDIVAASADLLPVLVVGAPLRHRHRIYNTAVVIHRGIVLGVVPKSYLPTYREFYERRQFARRRRRARHHPDRRAADVPFGPDLLFAAADLPGFVLHVEICEDMFVPVPPSAEAALAGATVLANLSGSPITIGRAEDRCLLARSASSRCLAAYVYAAAGEGESTTDLAWDGQTMIWENGVLLAESERFPKGERRSVADVDLELLASERLRMGTFDDNRRHHRVAGGVVPAHRVPARPAGRRHRAAPRGRAVPVRAVRSRTAGTGLLRGLQHPGRRAGAAAAGAGLPEGRHRRLRRAGLDARADRRRPGDGPGRPAAQRHPGVHAARASPPASAPRATRSAVPRARRDVRGDRHPRRPPS